MAPAVRCGQVGPGPGTEIGDDKKGICFIKEPKGAMEANGSREGQVMYKRWQALCHTGVRRVGRQGDQPRGAEGSEAGWGPKCRVSDTGPVGAEHSQ